MIRDLTKAFVFSWVAMALGKGITQDSAFAFTSLGYLDFLGGANLISCSDFSTWQSPTLHCRLLGMRQESSAYV